MLALARLPRQRATQSDGLSAGDHDDLIDDLCAGGDLYAHDSIPRVRRLQLDDHADAGVRSGSAHPVEGPFSIVAGDLTGNGHLDLAVANQNDGPVLLGNGDGTFQPQVTYAVGRTRCDRGGRLHRRRPHRSGRRKPGRQHRVGAAGQRRRHLPAPGHLRGGLASGRDRGGRLHRRRPHRSGRRKLLDCNTVSVLLGNGDGTFQPQVTYAVGSYPDAIVAGDFTGDGRTDLAVANGHRQYRVGAAGQGRRHLPAPGHLRGGAGPRRDRGGRLHRRRPHRPGRRKRRRQHRVGAAGQRRRHVPAPGHLRGRARSQTPSWRATSPATAASTWPSQTTATTPCRCCWATATAPSSPRSPTRSGAESRSRSWRATSTATAASTWPSQTLRSNTVSVLLGNGDGTFQPQVTYAVGSDPDAIVAGDFNGDGRTDLAVANY